MIYLDNAATKKILKEAKEEMVKYCEVKYGNPSATYTFGENVMKDIENARERIAYVINARKDAIYFTSGGSESDNWAIKCHNKVLTKSEEMYKKNAQIGIKTKKINDSKKHIITTKIEHHAVLNAIKSIEKNGAKVSYVRVFENGIVDINHLQKLITPHTSMISVMFANNEIGTIEPIKKIGEIALKNNIIFHTDAVQAYAHTPIDVDEMHIDMLSSSGHKFGGPKGVGFLYVRDKNMINPYIDGGMQEMGYRAGTSNTAGIMAMAKAAQISNENMKEWNEKICYLRDYLAKRIMSEVSDVQINGDVNNRLAGNLNVSFKGANGRVILEMLDANNICVSAMSACNSKRGSLSHVLKEIGVPDGVSRNTIRFTLSEENTKDDIDTTVEILKDIINKMRKK